MRVLLAALALGAASLPCNAADMPAGASSCSGCHAENSRLQSPIPPLHGRNVDELVGAMQEFRSGKRPATVMDRIAKGFTDDETRAIATWLAAQKAGSR